MCVHVCRIEAEEGFNLTVCCAPLPYTPPDTPLDTPLQITWRPAAKYELRCNPSYQSNLYISGFNATLDLTGQVTWYFSCSEAPLTHRLQDCALEPGSLWRGTTIPVASGKVIEYVSRRCERQRVLQTACDHSM